MSLDSRYSPSSRTMRVPPPKRKRQHWSTSARSRPKTSRTTRWASRSNFKVAPIPGDQRPDEVPLFRGRIGGDAQVTPARLVPPQHVERREVPPQTVEPGDAFKEGKLVRNQDLHLRLAGRPHVSIVRWSGEGTKDSRDTKDPPRRALMCLKSFVSLLPAFRRSPAA